METLVAELARRGKLLVGEPFFEGGVPVTVDRKGSGDASAGDLEERLAHQELAAPGKLGDKDLHCQLRGELLGEHALGRLDHLVTLRQWIVVHLHGWPNASPGDVVPDGVR